MNPEPVFIVGVPRSGTTLLTAMLAAHSRMSCGPETHFFRKLSKTDPELICAPENWPRAALDFVGSIEHSAFAGYESKRLLEKYQIEESEIEHYLKDKDPSIPSVLASVTENHMRRMGKSRWVEKTPDHLEHVSLVRAYYPRSPIIRIIRDPRDVALSLLKVPWGARSFPEALLYWDRFDRVSAGFFATDSSAYTLRYEDLVENTREEAQKLCRFIGEDFEEGMLDTASTAGTVNSRNVSWKSKVSEPIDSSRTAVWRRELGRRENQLAEALLGDRLALYRYPLDERFERLGEFFPASHLAVKFADGVESVASRGVRFWPTSKAERPTVRVYLGDPARDHWLRQSGSKKLIEAMAISKDILQAGLRKNRVFWIPGEVDGGWAGYCAFWLRKLLNPFKLDPGSSTYKQQ